MSPLYTAMQKVKEPRARNHSTTTHHIGPRHRSRSPRSACSSTLVFVHVLYEVCSVGIFLKQHAGGCGVGSGVDNSVGSGGGSGVSRGVGRGVVIEVWVMVWL